MTQDELIYRTNMGDILPGKVLVESNVFNIPERLREIDKGYFVLFNPENQRYELHHEEQDFTYCFTFPFEELDGRAIDYVRETRIERIDIIKRQMKERNRKLQEDMEKEFQDKIECIAKDVHKYALRHTDDNDHEKAFRNAYKTREI